MNTLPIEALQSFNFFYGDEYRNEYPTGSGIARTLWEIATDLSEHLIALFLPGSDGHRHSAVASKKLATDPRFKQLLCTMNTFSVITVRATTRRIRPDGRASSRS